MRIHFIVISIAFIPFFAQSQIDVQATLSNNRIFIGDQTELKIQAMFPVEYEFQALLLDTIKSVGLEHRSPQKQDYWETHKHIPGGLMYRNNIIIQAFLPDTVDIPPIPMLFSKGNVMDTFYTLPLRLTVFPVEPDSSGKLMPIATIIEEPQTWEDYQLLAVGVILALATIVGAIFLFLKRKKAKEIAAIPIVLSPIENAAQLLDTLEQEQLWQKGDYKAFCTKLSYTLRLFLEQAHGISALETTSSVILQQVEKQEDMQSELPVWKELLIITDAVKFANATPPIAFYETAIDKARGLTE